MSDETDLTEDELGEMWDRATPVELLREPPLECIDRSETGESCQGPVELRPAPPRGEKAWARCEAHQEARWARFEASDIERWADSDVAPPWFDPSYAGERWDENY